jgi:hypothetical protein
MTDTHIIDEAYARSKTKPIDDTTTVPETGPIKIELVWTNFYTRWPCRVCGGHTEKVGVLAEGPGGIRVCEKCLKAGDIDARLERHAAELEEIASLTRSLVGRLQVPTFEEWQDEEDRNVAYGNGISVEEQRKKREQYEAEWKASTPGAACEDPGDDADFPF